MRQTWSPFCRDFDTSQTLADLARDLAPTLIVAGDDDLVTVEHLEAMRAAVQDGRLAIVGTTSANSPVPWSKPALHTPIDGEAGLRGVCS